MQKKFEKHESCEKPLWNKQAVWENIEAAVLEKDRKPLAVWWFKLAAACILLIFGLLFLNDLSFKTDKFVRSSQNSPNKIVKIMRDTIYKTVTDTEFVIQKNTIRDTIWLKEKSLVIHDTFTTIKEVWVEKTMETSEKKQDIKPIKKEDSQIKYSFNQPVGEYFPKTQIRFKFINKAVYPADNNTKENFIVFNR